MKIEGHGNLEVKTTSRNSRYVYLTLHNIADVPTFNNYSSSLDAMADKDLHYRGSSKRMHGDEVGML